MLVETAELKAIRENIIRVRMSNWIQFPKDGSWLDQLFKIFSTVLKGLWNANDELLSIKTKCNWIMDQIDFLRWVHFFGEKTDVNIIQTGRLEYFMLLLIAPNGSTQEIREEYWNWVEERVLVPIQIEFPELYLLIVERFRRIIADLTSEHPRGGYDIE